MKPLKILFLSRWFPYPIDNGSKLRIYNLLRVLARNHEITLISFNDHPERSVDLPALAGICVETQVVPWKTYRASSPTAIVGLLSPIPRAVIDTHSQEMAQRISQALAGRSFDVVIASQIEMASYYPLFGEIPAIFDEIELGVPFERYTEAASITARLRNGLTWFKHRHYMRRALEHFQVGTVASEKERELLRETGIRDRNIAVVPNFIDLAEYPNNEPAGNPKSLIFTGSFRYRPNYEGILWFLEQVFPLIVEKIPELELIITGDHLNLPLPQHENMLLTGHIEEIQDLRKMLASARLSIVPLLTGGGTRLKILEAMACKTPVVSTTKGAEGLDVRHGENILIADSPQDFAQSVVLALQDQTLCDKLSLNSYHLVRTGFSIDAIADQYEKLINSLCK